MVFEIVLVLLLIKHWYVDFVDQSDVEIAHKGQYFHWLGIRHSFKHGILTAIIFLYFTHPAYALLAGLFDTLIHYHIDYMKMRFGSTDIKTKSFWTHLGFDQLLHQLTYIGLCLVFIN